MRHFLLCGVVQKTAARFRCVVPQFSLDGDVAVHINLAACRGLFAAAVWSLLQCVTFYHVVLCKRLQRGFAV